MTATSFLRDVAICSLAYTAAHNTWCIGAIRPRHMAGHRVALQWRGNRSTTWCQRRVRFNGTRRGSAMKVHLVDGTFELFRAFFGAPKATAPNGCEVGATRALLRSMAFMLRASDVTHVAIAFDHVIESFRNDLFGGYKTGVGIDPALFGQFHLAEDACRAFGLVVWPMVDFEADDALATGACLYDVPQVEQIVLCSPDKDLAQCVVGNRIVTLDRMRRRTRDEQGVVEKFGVRPRSIPDYLGLVGDTADGIPGLPRWGAKSTALVLARYECIDGIPSDVAAWDIKVRGAAALSDILENNRDDALLYRRLATLRRDAPITDDLEALRYVGTPASFRAFAADHLGDPRLSNLVPHWR